ncbi:aldo/keto reductase [Oceanibium sediminis]|uniref:aldo/keto reductase n=1 Tax=Oceanibium sediminis TaxID=2026339 RepID=UPI000DD380D5|nr:aldo/keto reductase [Oceanibium sediminis]
MMLPELGFGGAPLGGLLNPVDEAAAARTLDAALAAGLRYFDTAPYYGFGLSERRFGDALRDRADITLSTKVGRLLTPGLPPDPAAYGWPKPLPFHPVFDYGYEAVMRSFEDSLQRLGLDHVDILFLHDIGADTHTDPDEEARHFRDAMSGGYRALDELRRAGDISAIGIGVNEIDVCLRSLDHGDWDVFLLAGRYTLLEQAPLDALFPRLAAAETKVVVGGPFNSGILVGGSTWNYAEAPAEVRDRTSAIARVCAAHGVPLPAAALQFPLAHPQVSSVIPGTRTPAELAEVLAWKNTTIPPALWSDLKSEGLLAAGAPTPD